ncbi:MAG: hypothetical protein QOE11_1214 [Solirubrobacteraceae bacterium]|jgi:hypothetical protein|nr:hypothetical protein [Solirubrobacteraceae bacterium]
MIRSRLTLGLATAGTALALATTAIAASGPTITSLKTKQSGNKVTVTIKTSSFKIDTADVGKKPKAGKGHEHFAMDKGKFDHPKYSGANGTLAKQLGVDGKYSPSINNVVTYKGLPKGKHTITVFLVRNNHANYPNSGAKKTLHFTVK